MAKRLSIANLILQLVFCPRLNVKTKKNDGATAVNIKFNSPRRDISRPAHCSSDAGFCKMQMFADSATAFCSLAVRWSFRLPIRKIWSASHIYIERRKQHWMGKIRCRWLRFLTLILSILDLLEQLARLLLPIHPDASRIAACCLRPARSRPAIRNALTSN